ncbi:pentapeptide repeat-containing protein [Paenibacillus sp. A3]|uniref:pentapeptide repeat-containing protein n=1 Tax=Paenibacillus sp. A3 TaxID=1337054 RepID=UPI0009E76A26|nr:pentapeptide repeat-containing protein [Paenibacillus sp. A3]
MFEYADQSFTEKDFSQADFREGELRNCTFTRCRFRAAHLEELLTSGCQFIVKADSSPSSIRGR